MVAALQELGVAHVHLAVGPALAAEGGAAYLDTFLGAGLAITAAMIDFPQEDYGTLESIRRTGGIVPDAEWPGNRKRFVAAVEAARRLGTPYLSMHAGFLDATDAAAVARLRNRVRGLADLAAGAGLGLLLETGQETAEELAAFLEDLNHPAVGLNFDPANMILYGKGDPIAALRRLAPWVRHVHIKDARPTAVPGTWGTEVPWGEGAAGGAAFLATLARAGFTGAVAVEREAGADRLGDIRLALTRLAAFAGG